MPPIRTIVLFVFTSCTFALALGFVSSKLSAIPANDARDVVAIPNDPPHGDRWTNPLGMSFIAIPPGESWLGGGNDQPGHLHYTSNDVFYLGQFEVTQAEWCQLMIDNPSEFQRYGRLHESIKDMSDETLGRLPVENVSWLMCQDFLKQLNAKSPILGWKYRLPYPNEWEYALRGGPISKEQSAFHYYFETPAKELAGRANMKESKLNRTAPVGQYPPNSLGLYDMHGNVFEMCENSRIREQHRDASFVGCHYDDPDEFAIASRRNLTTSHLNYHGGGLRVVLVKDAK